MDSSKEYNRKIKEGNDYRLNEGKKAQSFAPVFDLSHNYVKGIKVYHESIKKFSFQETKQQILNSQQVAESIERKNFLNGMRQTSQIRVNAEKNLHLERANISERGRPVVYKVQGFFNIHNNVNFNENDVDKVYEDKAIGPGKVDTPGLASVTTLAFSALDGVEVLDKTFLKDAKIVGGGNVDRGDVVIAYEKGLAHMEIKDLQYDSIPEEKAFKKEIKDKIKGSKAEFVMFKMPYIDSELSTQKGASAVKEILKDPNHKEKTFFVVTSEKVIKINENIIDEKELPK